MKTFRITYAIALIVVSVLIVTMSFVLMYDGSLDHLSGTNIEVTTYLFIFGMPAIGIAAGSFFLHEILTDQI